MTEDEAPYGPSEQANPHNRDWGYGPKQADPHEEVRRLIDEARGFVRGTNQDELAMESLARRLFRMQLESRRRVLSTQIKYLIAGSFVAAANRRHDPQLQLLEVELNEITEQLRTL